LILNRCCSPLIAKALFRQHRSQAAGLSEAADPPMSAVAPIATELMRHNEPLLCAKMYGPAVRYKMDFQDRRT
jgi:hypothetical protein